MRLIFAVTGASGLLLAREALAAFASLPEMEIHLIVSRAARLALAHEGDLPLASLEKYAAMVHADNDLGAPPASGSWRHSGMVVCPCSMASLAAIASGCGQNLIHRAADVTLKERLPLVLVARETPYSLIHLRNMVRAAEAGAVIMPFCPAFYTGDTTPQGLMRQFSGRIMDQLRIPHDLCSRWRE